MDKYLVIIAVMSATSLVAVAASLFARIKSRKKRRLRKEFADAILSMNRLTRSHNPTGMRRVAVIADRIRREARMSGFTLKDIGISDDILTSLTNDAAQNLAMLMEASKRPTVPVTGGVWRSDVDSIGTDLSLTENDTASENIEVAELLLELMDDGLPSRPRESPKCPDTLEALFEGLTDGDIEGHVEESFMANVLPA